MKVCPNADLRDGMLDVMLLHPVPKFEFLKIFPQVYSGGHVKHPQVEILRGRSIAIKEMPSLTLMVNESRQLPHQ